MKYFLFDASAVSQFYIGKDVYKNILYCLLKYKKEGTAFFFLPSFCIAEVFNTFAKYRYRHKTIDNKKYEDIVGEFRENIHDRKLFYSYDLNRYHNLNCGEIFPIEHSFETEYSVTNTKFGDPVGEIEKLLKDKDKYDNINKHYLSALDILIIAMGMELRRILKGDVFIVTIDKRLSKINEECIKKGKKCAKTLYMSNLSIGKLKIILK